MQASQPLYFYHFLGAHSLLIGLLPFFLPVYLWTHGLGLAGLSLLIGISGFSFALSLRCWQYASTRWSLKHLVGLTFVLEILLVFVVGLFTMVPGSGLFQTQPAGESVASAGLLMAAISIGLFNGIYNAFFWTTQRTLFIELLGKNDTGRQYGNFQIFVTLFLKAGILLGGFLLDSGGFVWLLAISAGISGASGIWLARSATSNRILNQQSLRVGNRQSLTYSDQRGSRQAFAIDGIFLYLESHFWTLSLFLLVHEDYSRLGFAVVLLAAGFAVMFYLIKNRIDKQLIERVYKASVYLYLMSWLLRLTLTDSSLSGGADNSTAVSDGVNSVIDSGISAGNDAAQIAGASSSAGQNGSLLITLLVITFFSSFFRLTFNKRFFDVARQEGAVNYLLMKSYSSQWVLGLFFTLLSVLLFNIAIDVQTTFQVAYAFAALLSLVYLGYRDTQGPAHS